MVTGASPNESGVFIISRFWGIGLDVFPNAFCLRKPANLASSVRSNRGIEAMKKIESWKAWTFIGSLAILAVIINATHGYLPRESSVQERRNVLPPQQPNAGIPYTHLDRPTQGTAGATKPEHSIPANIQKTPEELAAERAAQHAQYLARYLVNTNITRKTGARNTAIAVVSEDRKFNRTLTTAIANRLKDEKIELSSSFFTPEFVSDRLFDQALGGSTEVLKNLELAKSLDLLLLARQRVSYTPNPSLQNVLTANMELEVSLCPVATPDANQTWTLTANGAGFTEKDARNLAEDRLVKQIASDPKMSLSQINQ